MDIIPLFGLFLITQFPRIAGHGRLMNPPARNSLWRFGFPGPVNYNDNELFCGGYTVHQVDNDGKCGLCGDEYKLTGPRPHETGGKYGNAIITRRYYSGQDITVKIDLTSNHMGFFVFKMCPMKYYERECKGQLLMDRNVLPVVYPNGTLAKKYFIESQEKSLTLELTLRLPRAFNCSRCCMQWTYTTGNSWGICEDGTGGIGCGRQETFVNCADVAVMPMPFYRKYWLDPRLTSSSRANPYRKYYRDSSKADAPMTALAVRYQRCIAIDSEAYTPGMNESCQVRCMKYPPDCPQELCKCVKDVRAIGEFKKIPMSDQWCLDQCNVHPVRNCDRKKCEIIFMSSI